MRAYACQESRQCPHCSGYLRGIESQCAQHTRCEGSILQHTRSSLKKSTEWELAEKSVSKLVRCEEGPQHSFYVPTPSQTRTSYCKGRKRAENLTIAEACLHPFLLECCKGGRGERLCCVIAAGISFISFARADVEWNTHCVPTLHQSFCSSEQFLAVLQLAAQHACNIRCRQ
jgi:hypothetical protein